VPKQKEPITQNNEKSASSNSTLANNTHFNKLAIWGFILSVAPVFLGIFIVIIQNIDFYDNFAHSTYLFFDALSAVLTIMFLGSLLLFPVLSIWMCNKALKKINETSEKGRNLAITGLIVSNIFPIVILILAYLLVEPFLYFLALIPLLFSICINTISLFTEKNKILLTRPSLISVIVLQIIILVLAIVLLAIYQPGSLPDACQVSTGFNCNDYSIDLSETNTINIQLINNMAETINISNFNMTKSGNDVCVEKGTITPTTLIPDGSSFELNCRTSASFLNKTSSDKVKIEFAFDYTTNSNFPQSAFGIIYTTIK
jgi:hypothetical protein